MCRLFWYYTCKRQSGSSACETVVSYNMPTKNYSLVELKRTKVNTLGTWQGTPKTDLEGSFVTYYLLTFFSSPVNMPFSVFKTPLENLVCILSISFATLWWLPRNSVNYARMENMECLEVQKVAKQNKCLLYPHGLTVFFLVV